MVIRISQEVQICHASEIRKPVMQDSAHDGASNAHR